MSDLNWERTHRQIEGFLRKRVSSKQDVDDLLQDIMLKIYEYLGVNPMPREPVQWVFRVTRNALVDHYRQKKSGKLDLVDDIEQRIVFDGVEEVDDGGLASEASSWLKGWLEGLEEPYREALLAVDVEGITQKAYSARVGISISGAKSRVQRGRKALRELFLRCCAIELDGRGRLIGVQPHRGGGSGPSGCCSS